MILWLHNGPVEITKKMILKVTWYLTLDKKKTMRCLSHEDIKANTEAELIQQGLSISNIINPLIKFAVRLISHKFYQSNRFNSVPFMVVH